MVLFIAIAPISALASSWVSFPTSWNITVSITSTEPEQEVLGTMAETSIKICRPYLEISQQTIN
ncbi:MAG: hypothetical protein IJS39_13670 [Synergistaceae bacterium]|nr:hypothetical protein [Synergistaceae bacterium]